MGVYSKAAECGTTREQEKHFSPAFVQRGGRETPGLGVNFQMVVNVRWRVKFHFPGLKLPCRAM
eukprot:13875806-Alexandrium_andersonii.AAC.1